MSEFVSIIIKLVSWNVRGLGETSKRALIRRDLGAVRDGWIALQETKLYSVDNWLVNQIRGQGEWGFCFLGSVGSAGGILCCWDKVVFEASECVVEQRFIAIKGIWVDGFTQRVLYVFMLPIMAMRELCSWSPCLGLLIGGISRISLSSGILMRS